MWDEDSSSSLLSLLSDCDKETPKDVQYIIIANEMTHKVSEIS